MLARAVRVSFQVVAATTAVGADCFGRQPGALACTGPKLALYGHQATVLWGGQRWAVAACKCKGTMYFIAKLNAVTPRTMQVTIFLGSCGLKVQRKHELFQKI